ncbi:hypothetical protein FPZ43_05000 [Mucilaginibacter pallidiroseus]|uniref:Uncharacterized protein n=1 Tax=Mucilaginibacter pallidiroseus TaxID=2599295 RepID=A0A563UG94_9SPHI|nr:hypothetical protein [Mucilaginibacter pallidiroseus]TWR30299.1 hypothetical protein FPZ43_05000 [Mucilaginibacter pallidiroseus]
MNTSQFKFLTVAFLLLTASAGFAQTDTIRLKDKRLNTSTLKPGMRQYLVYFQMPQSPKTLRYWLWLRNTQVQKRNGENVFVTTQNWFGSDTLSYRSGYSVNRVSDFSPIYHSETVAGKNKAFNWAADKVTGADTVANNTKKGFAIIFAEPCYNWNLDIETFEMLPLAAGKTFAINFYDAGFGKPEFTIYKVSGSEVIATYDNHKVDCWKLVNESDFKGQHATQTFWITKKGHEFIKEEDVFPGGYRYKVKLPATAFNILQRISGK